MTCPKSKSTRRLYPIIFLLCLCAALAASARTRDFYGRHDSGVFGVSDLHYQGVLFPEAYKNMASTRIAYPGLWSPEFNSAAAGILPGQFPGGGFRGLYGWTDIDNGPATAGLWIGNFNFGSEQRAFYVRYDSLYLMDANEFSLRGAVWITPFRGKALRGLSITVDIDNSYSYDGNTYLEEYDRKLVYVNLATLFNLGDNYRLRAGIRTYNLQTAAPARLDNGKIFTDGIYAGIVDNKNRTLDISLDNSYGVSYDWVKSDTLTAALLYTEGFARNYQKHLLFAGIKAEASASFLANIGEEVGTFQYGEYFRNLTTDGWIMRYNVTVPLVLDAHIYGTLRCALSIGPRVNYTQVSYKNAQNQHLYTMDIPRAELSLRGTVGNKFDVFVKPTFQNDVFISALEIRYRF